MENIIHKFKFKATGVLINAPAAIEKEFKTLGFTTSSGQNVKSSNTLLFVNNMNEFLDFLSNGLKNIEPDCVFWIAYPKISSKIKTDINRDSLRLTAERFGIKTVSAISIDETWSALRFRPIDKVGK